MDKLVINGGRPLRGEVVISGAKNSALPIMAATLLASDNVTVSNIPNLEDVKTMVNLLAHLGAQINYDSAKTLQVNASSVNNLTAPFELVNSMRASILVLGPMLARFGRANVSLPGGCAIGSRPVDLHIKALREMGSEITVKDGFIEAYVKQKRLRGTTITFDTITVGGTENIMMAAVLADGKTIIKNAAREPEIVDLANFLNMSGADIKGAGDSVIEIQGVESLGGGSYSVMPDRIEAGTYLAAAAITKGQVRVNNVLPENLFFILEKFREAGAIITIGDTWIDLNMHGLRPKAVNIETAPYPGFPTDLQAQFMVLNTVASGSSIIVENIFENRFMHVNELLRMGAQIKLNGNISMVTGIEALIGATVMATDLRASASLILAGLVASQKTSVERIFHVDRGYEIIEDKFSKLGADIKRCKEE